MTLHKSDIGRQARTKGGIVGTIKVLDWEDKQVVSVGLEVVDGPHGKQLLHKLASDLELI